MNKDIKANDQVIAAAHQKVYDSVADEYEERAQTRSTSSLERVRRFASFITSGKAVLELGSAVGQELKNFHDLGFETTGVELSPKMAIHAARRSPSSNVIVGDFATTDLGQSYDAVYAQAFIHLFPKDEATVLMHKIRSLLTPDGVAFFGTTKAKASEEGWVGKADYKGNPKRYRRFWTKEELEQTLAESGFKVIDYYEELGLEGKDRMNITVTRS